MHQTDTKGHQCL